MNVMAHAWPKIIHSEIYAGLYTRSSMKNDPDCQAAGVCKERSLRYHLGCAVDDH